MAKQTFTTGQVLTAAQMTSLQQTAMGGGSATAKIASYTLVAADAGTTVIMNSASSTTITVNTALFAAGDTVLIVNQGAGVCTVTAGTATVSTAGSLALSQNETGTLYFLSTSAAIFSDYTQGAAAAAALTLISTTTIGTTVSSVTVSSAFSATYDNYLITVNGGVASATNNLSLKLGSTTTGYFGFGFYGNATATTLSGDNYNNSANFPFAALGDTNNLSGYINLQNPNLAKATMIYTLGSRTGTGGMSNLYGSETSTTQHTAFTLTPSTGTITGGTIRVYGYANS